MNDVSSHTVLSPMSHHQDANQFGPHHSTGPHNGRASCRSRREARAAKRRRTSPKWEARKCLTATRRLEKTVSSARSEEHTSELQSRGHLVCRLLLEKKKKKKKK